MAVIAIEPAVKAPFVSYCIQTSLMDNTTQNDPVALVMY